MQAGRTPDVFDGCCDFFPIWAQKGYCLDLRPYVARDLDRSALDDWDPAQYKALFLPDGRQYGLPKYHGALALFYNKDLFDQYGVDYPDDSWDHDDYLDAMKRLTHDRNNDGKTDLWGSMVDISWERIQVHVNAWGGHFVDPRDAKRSLMSEPPALAAMEWLRARMWDDKVMATFLDVQNMTTAQAFLAGKLAMVEDGSWRLREILSQATFNLGIAPLPAGPVRRATLATTDGFGIFAGARHPDAAWELLKFLIGQEAGRAMAQAHFLQPARASLLEEWAGFIRKEFPAKTRGLNINAFADGHLKGYSVVSETFANMAEAQRLAYVAWDKIFTLGQASVDLMKTTSRQIEEAQQSKP
jgi:multiple sugar transport system substrate-binding protein